MRWVWSIGGVLAGLVLVVVAVGAMLPRAHTASRQRGVGDLPHEAARRFNQEVEPTGA